MVRAIFQKSDSTSSPDPRFGIEQDGFDNRFHVAAHTLAVIGKRSRDTRNVCRARVGCDQALDQLPANKRADIRMIEETIDGIVDVSECRGADIGIARRARRQRNAIQQSLRIAIVVGVPQFHRL